MIQQGDVGTIINISLGLESPAAGTNAAIRYRKPSGAYGEWAASFVGGEELSYQIQEGDIDEFGDWWIQGYVEFSGWRGSTEVLKMVVGRRLTA